MDSSQSELKTCSLLTFQGIYLLAGDVLKCCSCSQQVRGHWSTSVLLPSPPVAWTLLSCHKRLLRHASPQRGRTVVRLEDYVMHWLAVHSKVRHCCWMPVDVGCSWRQGATREGQYSGHGACTMQHLRQVMAVETSMKPSHWAMRQMDTKQSFSQQNWNCYQVNLTMIWRSSWLSNNSVAFLSTESSQVKLHLSCILWISSEGNTCRMSAEPVNPIQIATP